MVTDQQIEIARNEREAAFDVKLKDGCEKLHLICREMSKARQDDSELVLVKTGVLGAVSMFVTMLDLNFLGVKWVYSWIVPFVENQEDWYSGDLYLRIKASLPKNFFY